MTSRRATQRDNILAALQAGRLLDVPTVQREFGCFRLAARIAELRREGFIVLTITERGTENAFAKYVLLQGGGVNA
jgi:hypothetical protein